MWVWAGKSMVLNHWFTRNFHLEKVEIFSRCIQIEKGSPNNASISIDWIFVDISFFSGTRILVIASRVNPDKNMFPAQN